MTKLSAVRNSPKVIDGSAATGDLDLSADVCVIGSGAGGAVAASVLAGAGLDVIIVEEGGYYSAAADFTMREADVTPKLYQESGQRATLDLGIALLQGRAVGGTTVVNWTTSFRTPEDVVDHWAKRHAARGFKYADLVPHYEKIEERLSIHKVDEAAMNRNNRKLYDGCKALGWQVDTIRRNVHACMQTGACGLGCPINAKRSMLVTLIPDAIDAGARLLFRCRIDRITAKGGEITEAHGAMLDGPGHALTGKRVTIRARRFVLSGGAINTPAILLRSGIDGGGIVGTRTFLHPVVGSIGLHKEPIEAFYGAPQSAASHQFAHRGEEVGLFLEAAPIYPALTATAIPGFGAMHRKSMETIADKTFHIALAIDGFHDSVPGGTVKIRPSGAPVLDYVIPPAVWAALREGQKRLAEEAFAAGAIEVSSLHDPPVILASPKEIGKFDGAAWEPNRVAVFSAHIMGGCRMGDDPKDSVVRSEDLRHHALTNLYIVDGSVFPTSLGVNPQESIYGLSRLMATRIAASITR